MHSAESPVDIMLNILSSDTSSFSWFAPGTHSAQYPGVLE
jgi:hypothetical protein